MNANAPGPSNSGDTDTNKSSANTINHQLAHIQSLLTSQLHQTQQWLTEEQERAAEADRRWVKEGERREDIATVIRDIEGLVESRGKRGGREGHSGGEQNDQESKNEDTNRLMTIVQEAHNERMQMLQSFFIGIQEEANERRRLLLEQLEFSRGEGQGRQRRRQRHA